MGETAGFAARAWHSRRRDQRLGYSALGLGAGGFVLVLVGTLIVTEVVPGLLDDKPPAQAVVPSSTLRPDILDGAGDSPLAPVLDVAEGSEIRPASAPGTGAGQSGSGSVPPGDPGQPQQPGPGPGPGPGPQPPPQPQPEGPVGSIVDPVVVTVAGTVDGTTGGASAPVTRPVVDLVDGLTDTVDGLLGAATGPADLS